MGKLLLSKKAFKKDKRFFSSHFPLIDSYPNLLVKGFTLKAVVIVAGGSGTRMGSNIPKQFLPLAGKPILLRTLDAYWVYDQDLSIVLVLPQSDLSYWEEISGKYLSPSQIGKLTVCTGGASRCESVFNGLSQLHSQVEYPSSCWVAIHDGVRPFVSSQILKEAFDMAHQKGASVACVPVKSSLRKKASSGQSVPVNRADILEVQTPQTFRLDNIYQAFLQRSHDNFSDDASLYQEAGHEVFVCAGSYDNIKITTPEDLELGELILKRRKK